MSEFLLQVADILVTRGSRTLATPNYAVK